MRARGHDREDALLRQQARSGSTAVSMQAEMWVMPVSEFIKLPEFRPHQELLAQGKLSRWDSSMNHVFFLSHQWTSWSHPDHTMLQLRTFQRLITRMVCGQCPDTVPGFADAIFFPKSVKITSKKWREIAESSFVWMDFFSVPQQGSYYATETLTELTKAVDSIPAFIERCTHFFVVCPTIQHDDMSDVVCDFASWERRGWCRCSRDARAVMTLI